MNISGWLEQAANLFGCRPTWCNCSFMIGQLAPVEMCWSPEQAQVEKLSLDLSFYTLLSWIDLFTFDILTSSPFNIRWRMGRFQILKALGVCTIAWDHFFSPDVPLIFSNFYFCSIPGLLDHLGVWCQSEATTLLLMCGLLWSPLHPNEIPLN